jgi:AcrR family transcriptional regulator
VTTVEPGTALSRSQAERRRRVIGAAIDLGAGGGYDAVQMRDLSARSDVALGTIYRYYSSKDHVLAEALVEWVEDLEGQIARRPPTGVTTADRMVDILRRATRAMERQPKLSEAVITALAAADPKVIECQRVVGTTMARIQDRAFSDDFDAETRAGIVRMLGWIWYAALVGWVNGWSGIGKVGDELELAARLLIEPHEA